MGVLVRTMVVALTALVLLVGCGGDESGTAGQTTDTAAQQGGSWEEAQQKIEAAMELQEFTSSAEPIDMPSLKGKRVWIINGNAAVPFNTAVAEGVEEAATAAGLETHMVDGKGQPANWAKLMQQAVSQGADAVCTCSGAPPGLMKTAMKAAQDAKIPVIDAFDNDIETPLVEGQFAEVSISFRASGALQADYVIAQQKGTPTSVLVFGDSEFPSEVIRVEGIQEEFKRLAPETKVIVKDVLVSKLATDLPRITQTELRRDPDIKWIIVAYDAQATYVVPAIQQADLASEVKVVGSDNVPANLDWVKSGHVQVFDVGAASSWVGWAAVDAIGRALLGKPAVNEDIPVRVFVQSNLEGKDTSDLDALFGTGFKEKYKELWGL